MEIYIDGTKLEFIWPFNQYMILYQWGFKKPLRHMNMISRVNFEFWTKPAVWQTAQSKPEESKCSQPGGPDVHVDLCSSFYPTFLRHFSVEVHKSSNNLVVTNFLEVFQLKWPFVTIWLVVVEKYPHIRDFKSFSNWLWIL